MTVLQRALTSLNGWLIRLYPLDFQRRFGQELQHVHEAALSEMYARGWPELARFYLREVAGWGRLMIALHIGNPVRRILSSLRPMPSAHQADQRDVRLGRNDMSGWLNASPSFDDGKASARLAALPVLLFGIGIALNALISGPWYAIPLWRLYLGVALGLLPMFAIGIGAFVAMARRAPDWGWTWIGTAFMGVTVFVKTLVEEMADEGRSLMGAGGEIVLMLTFLFVGGLLILGAAWRGSRRSGLLSLGFSAAFGLSLFMAFTAGPFFRHDLALLAAPAALLTAVLVYAFIRGSVLARMGVILGAAVMNGGIVLMGSLVWREWLSQGGGSSPTAPLLVLSTAMVAAGPLLGWLLRPLRSSFGHAS